MYINTPAYMIRLILVTDAIPSVPSSSTISSRHTTYSTGMITSESSFSLRNRTHSHSVQEYVRSLPHMSNSNCGSLRRRT